MPRSLDIARKPKHRPAPAPAPSSPAPSSRRKKSSGGMVFFVFVVAILTLGFSYAKLAKNPTVKNASTQKTTAEKTANKTADTKKTTTSTDKDSTKDSNTTTDSAKTDTTKDSASTDTPKTDSTSSATPTSTNLKIQVLNGTGIDTVTDQVKTTLETNKFPVESTSKAQFEYGQTYIYYRPSAVDSAKKISGILSAYKPTLSESQISGLFDILIIIGKQNLPAT